MWGREIVKLRNQLEDWLKMHYLQIFHSNSYNRVKFLVEKYVIKGLPTIQGPFGHISFESPGKMTYFSLLAQIFHLSLPKIWQAHINVNYFYEGT